MSTLNVTYSTEDSGLSYGYFHCSECESSFFGGGEALHRANCSRKAAGYEGLIYVIGAKVLTSIMSGEDRINPVTVEDLERCLPEMVAAYRKRQTAEEAEAERGANAES